jgi:hypothetical protein
LDANAAVPWQLFPVGDAAFRLLRNATGESLFVKRREIY